MASTTANLLPRFSSLPMSATVLRTYTSLEIKLKSLTLSSVASPNLRPEPMRNLANSLAPSVGKFFKMA